MPAMYRTDIGEPKWTSPGDHVGAKVKQQKSHGLETKRNKTRARVGYSRLKSSLGARSPFVPYR